VTSPVLMADVKSRMVTVRGQEEVASLRSKFLILEERPGKGHHSNFLHSLNIH